MNCCLPGSSELSSQQRLLSAMFANYDGDGRPDSNRSRAVLVSFGAKLVRIINLVNKRPIYKYFGYLHNNANRDRSEVVLVVSSQIFGDF